MRWQLRSRSFPKAESRVDRFAVRDTLYVYQAAVNSVITKELWL